MRLLRRRFGAALGKRPTWDHRTNTLYWNDIIGQTITMAYLGEGSYGIAPADSSCTSRGVFLLGKVPQGGLAA